jgi:hypothetical protein
MEFRKRAKEVDLDVPEVIEGEFVEDISVFERPMSRRKALKLAVGGLAGLAGVAALPPLYEGIQNEFNRDELKSSIHELEESLSEKYGIRIRVWSEHPMDRERPAGEIKESLLDKSLYRSYHSLLAVDKVLSAYDPKIIKAYVSGIEVVYSIRPRYSGTVAEGATTTAVTSFGGNITVRAGFQSPVSYRAMFGEVLDPLDLHHELARLY